MGMISGIRAPLPVVEVPAPSVAEARPVRPERAGGTAAVATPVRADAVTQAPAMAGTELRLLVTRATAESSAAAAAEAARHAYIKASIAAGISPLPLP